MIDIACLRILLLTVTGWLDRREREALAYLIEENRLLRRQLRAPAASHRRRSPDGWPRGRTGWAGTPCARSPRSRRRTRCCAGIGSSSRGNGRTQAGHAAAASSWRSAGWSSHGGGESDVGLHADPRRAEESSAIAWAARPFARILKAAGLPPVPQRPTSWQTFLQAHWGVIAGADFFTTEVWTWRGLVTYYTVFVIDLASRRVHMLGSTPHPTSCLWAKWPGC